MCDYCTAGQAEVTTRKIQELVRVGYNLNTLVAGVERLKQCSWSTTTVEQGHGAASTMRKLHGDYGKNVLTARAMVHMMRPLVQPDPASRQAERLRAQAGRLESRVPTRHTGRQQYFKECLEVARQQLPPGQQLGTAVTRELMARHAQEWARLSTEQQRAYSGRAEVEQGRRLEKIHEDIVMLKRQASFFGQQ